MAKAAAGDPIRLAKAELALSRAVLSYAARTYRPGPDTIVYADPRRAPPRSDLETMRLVGRGDALDANLRTLLRVNPLYAELDAAGRSPEAAGLAPVVQANLARLRGLPPDLGGRYVLVDVPAARLWLYEGGAPVDSMRAIVGAPKHPTPLMAASLRFAVFNPYWNVPTDLARDDIAPRVLRQGVGVLAEREMEVLADWSPNAPLVDPAAVDWAAVAAGRQVVRLRQRPGPRNMMGRVKLEMPNRLGIYLHDTPDRRSFAGQARLKSAGCVRLEDADRLSRWLFDGREPARSGVEQRVPLPRPVPIYIVYRTMAPENGRLERRSDVYGLDARWTQSVRVAQR